MYKKQVEHMLSRFDEAKKYIKTHGMLITKIEGIGKTKETFCKDFEENSEDLKRIAYALAVEVTNSKPSCYSYAAAIAVIAEELGYDYEIYAGLALDKERDVKLYEKVSGRTYSSSELPFMANYLYVKSDEVDYDFVNEFKNIEHIYTEKVEK